MEFFLVGLNRHAHLCFSLFLFYFGFRAVMEEVMKRGVTIRVIRAMVTSTIEIDAFKLHFHYRIRFPTRGGCSMGPHGRLDWTLAAWLLDWTSVA